MLGMLLGFGVAGYRSFFLDQFVMAGGEGKKGPAQGIFSPPGTFEGGTVVPAPGEPPFKGKIGRTIDESTSDWPPLARAPKGAPNVMYIVLDDVGYAALGCYGSPVCQTPHMDKLAKNGIRFNNFHTTALCSPSRSCFLTGRNHHSNAMACITEGSTGYPGSYGRVPLANGLLSEMLTPFVDRPVVDMTELKGNYQVALDLSMEEVMAIARKAGAMIPGAGGGGDTSRSPAEAAADPSGSSIFNTVQQLGLKLEARKAPIPQIIIDHVEKMPTEN